MATCLDVITLAMRLARVLASGAEPQAEETEDGMVCLQSLYDGWVAAGLFGRLTDSYLTADDTAQEGYRYLLASGVALTEPTIIAAEDSADGIARAPRDLAIYESVNSTEARSVRLYDRTGWVDLLNLTTTDEAPLSGRGKIGLASALACSGAFIAMFNDTAAMNPDIRRSANQFQAALSYKIGTTRDRAQAEYF